MKMSSIFIKNKWGGETMTLDEVKAYYKNCYQFRLETGMSMANFGNWKRRGSIPAKSQIRLQTLTNGKLKVRMRDIR